VEVVRSFLIAFVQALLWPFAGLHPLVTLIPIGVLLGIGMLWILSRLSDQQAISAMKRRIHAHLYELRLFVDEPKLVWKAQIALLRDNLRYLALMLVPASVLTVPLIPLFYALDGFYGSRPLRAGVSTVLTVQLRGTLRKTTPRCDLTRPLACWLRALPCACSRPIR
jgi:uncharacterized membrane protein (DUF106 family)